VILINWEIKDVLKKVFQNSEIKTNPSASNVLKTTLNSLLTRTENNITNAILVWKSDI